MERFSRVLKRILLFYVSVCITVISSAQDSLSDSAIEFENIIIEEGPFYAQLWFWIVLGLFFLSILILLIRGGGRRRGEVEVEKTDEKDKKE